MYLLHFFIFHIDFLSTYTKYYTLKFKKCRRSAFDKYIKNDIIFNTHGGFIMKEYLTKMKSSFKKHWGQFVDEGKKCIAEFKNPATRKKQIPNLFTASRLLAPIFILPAALSGNLLLAGIFVGIFASTDAIDGYLARKYDSTSEFGRKLDALTDKLFIGALLVLPSIYNPVLLSTIVMEGIISAINIHSQLNNNNPKTEYIGKIKTAALFGTVALNYLSLAFHIPNAVLNIALGSTLGLQTISAAKYLNIAVQKEKDKKKKTDFEEPLINRIEEPEQAAELAETLGLKPSLTATTSSKKPQELSPEERARQLREIREQILQLVSPETINEPISKGPEKSLRAKK